MSVSRGQPNGLQPGVTTSSARPASPYEGQMLYETDTKQLVIWNGSAWTYLYQSPPTGRNLLVNGSQDISQRYGDSQTGFFGISSGAALYGPDMWVYSNQSSITTYMYPSYPLNSSYGLNGTILDAGGPTSLTGSQYLYLRQTIEGKKVQHLRWGTASALPVTLSFVAQTIGAAKTFVVELETINGHISRSWSIGANTVQYISMTFPGSTAYAIPNATNSGMGVNFWLGAATNWSGGASLATSWTANGVGNNTRAFGCSNFLDGTTSQLRLQNIQLEVGSFATPFEVVPYEITLQDCHRRFQRWVEPPAIGLQAGGANSSIGRMGMALPVEMAGNPTLASSGSFPVYDGVNVGSFTSAQIAGNYSTAKKMEFDTSASTIAASSNQERATKIYHSGLSLGYIDLSADF